MLDILLDLGVHSPTWAQVVADYVATGAILFTIDCLKWERHIDVGRMNLAAADGAGGLSMWTSINNEKTFKDNRPIALAYLRYTRAAVADLQAY